METSLWLEFHILTQELKEGGATLGRPLSDTRVDMEHCNRMN